MKDRPLSPLSIPTFRALWATTVLSNMGSTIQAVAAAWFMTTLTTSPVKVALVQASANLPIMLFALWAGAVADAYDRRRIMLSAQLFMLLVSTVLALLAWSGQLSPAALLAMTFMIGAGTALNWPAMQVLVGEIVPSAALPRAVALNGLGVNLARTLGPACGGAILALFGAAVAFIVNAVSFIPLVTMLVRWRYDAPARILPREKIGAAMAAGLRYAALSRALRAVAVRAFVFGVAAGSVPSLMPLVANDLLHGGPFVFGILLASFGAGAIGGAIASASMRARWSSEQIVARLSLVLAAGATLAGLSRSMPLTTVAMALAGAAWLTVLTTFNVVTQLSSPRWVVARALSIYQMATYGGLAAGSWFFGALASRAGCTAALAVAGGGLLIVAAIGRVCPLRGESLDMAPRADWHLPETSVPVEMRSGPIVVAVDYRVLTDDSETFLSLMAERSRILRRDGARDWMLQQDLVETEAWVETYRFATWHDYVLLNQRRTRADQLVHEALAAVQAPGSSLVVHRRIQRQANGKSGGTDGHCQGLGSVASGAMTP
ncbi:MFS transporter [Novosphingobium sp. 11B]